LIKLAEEEAALRKTLSQLEEKDEIDQATIKASAARRKADYQADMDLLSARKKAAELDAEARVYE
jgi:predicted nucleotidyltransferase